ncbi:SHOCT domain-containing protein [Desulfosoma sp.]|uniref:SHOCT domain-containing protein n=2 Tax=Desulfosoma sp. TaxID=2603217 RepID=UPI0040494DFC
MIMNILLWILIAVGIIHLVRRLFAGPKTEPSTTSETSRALEILKERYARGEITAEEFQTMQSHLR